MHECSRLPLLWRKDKWWQHASFYEVERRTSNVATCLFQLLAVIWRKNLWAQRQWVSCLWARASCNDVLAAPTLLREEKRTAEQRRVLIFRQLEMQEDQPNTSLQWLEITRTSKMFLQCCDSRTGRKFLFFVFGHWCHWELLTCLESIST